jgi:hypothetical protein
MPQFEKRSPSKREVDSHPEPQVPMTTEPRCKVCKSPYRPGIDKMLAAGVGHTAIARAFNDEVDRRSIANHADKHLNYNDAAIRQIIQHEAEQMSENIEDGVKGILARKAFLQTALHKVHQAIINDEVSVEVRDAIGIIQQLEKMDSATESAAVEELRIQFNAFLQALKETVDQEKWEEILARTKDILQANDIGMGSTSSTALPQQLESPK